MLFLLFVLLRSWADPLEAQEFPPKQLSEMGLFDSIIRQDPKANLVPYTVNSPYWSDGTHKTRFMLVPNKKKIIFSSHGNFEFPTETILIKNFYLDLVLNDPSSRTIIETRLFVKSSINDSSKGYSYQWNEEGSEAFLLTGSKTTTFVVETPADLSPGFFLQDYYFPSRNDCLSCHTKAAGRVLGIRASQLNRRMDNNQNQLELLEKAGIFSKQLPNDLDKLPLLPNPFDPKTSLERRARSYLATNCSQCHRPQSAGRTIIDLRYDTELSQTNTVNVYPTLGALGSTDARILAPGSANNSTIYLRMLNQESFRMPSIGSSVIDVAGSKLIADWINRMGTVTNVSDSNKRHDSDLRLSQNYPNPFNNVTNIEFKLGSFAKTRLSIIDVLGRRIRTIVDAPLSAGHHKFHWDGCNDGGTKMSTGIYFYNLQSGIYETNRRLSLIK